MSLWSWRYSWGRFFLDGCLCFWNVVAVKVLLGVRSAVAMQAAVAGEEMGYCWFESLFSFWWRLRWRKHAFLVSLPFPGQILWREQYVSRATLSLIFGQLLGLHVCSLVWPALMWSSAIGPLGRTLLHCCHAVLLPYNNGTHILEMRDCKPLPTDWQHYSGIINEWYSLNCLAAMLCFYLSRGCSCSGT